MKGAIVLCALALLVGVSSGLAGHVAPAEVRCLDGDEVSLIKCRDGSSCGNDNSTCCQLTNGKFGCCPYGPYASCCGDGYCCPLTFDCIQESGNRTCKPQSTTCGICQTVMTNVYEYGCTAACAALPGPVGVACKWIVNIVGCDTIMKFITLGYTPNKICNSLGLCGSPCPCGRCSKYTYGSCLGIPARCPKPLDNAVDINDVDVNAPMPMEQIVTFYENLAKSVEQNNQSPKPQFCLNGVCQESAIDCCITCF